MDRNQLSRKGFPEDMVGKKKKKKLKNELEKSQKKNHFYAKSLFTCGSNLENMLAK